MFLDKAPDHAAIPLGGSAWIRRRHRFPRKAPFFGRLLTSEKARLGFSVQLRRFGSGAALSGQTTDLDIPFQGILMDAQPCTDLDLFAGFCSLILIVNLAAVDGIAGELSGLVESRSPQPFVQSDLFRFIVRWHLLMH